MANKVDIDKLILLVKESNNWDEFKAKVSQLVNENTIIEPADKNQEDLSDFNKKLKQGLEWNPKDHKKK